MRIKKLFLGRKWACLSLVVSTIMLAGGCASIPKESVVLSQEIGKGIAEGQNAYISLLNRYFDQKKKLIDLAVMEKYLPRLISNIRQGLEAEGENPDLFDSTMATDIVKNVIRKRDEMQADLEKARILLLERIEADHKLLLQANATLTGLLRSAVEAKEATASLTETLAKPINSGFDFFEFEKFLAEYLNRTGDAAAEIGEIYEKMKLLIKKEGE